jgi:hypothetical protein
MSPPAIVLFALTAVALIVWVWGFTFLLAAARSGTAPSPLSAEQFTAEDPEPPRDLIVGSVDVEGEAADLSTRGATVLAQLGMSGVLKILERTDRRIVFEGLHGYNAAFGLNGGGFRRGQVRFTPLPQGRTRIEYAVETPRSRVLLAIGGVFVVLGLIAIVVGFWLAWTYAVSDPNPGVRWQVVQMAQTCHFLWPQFMFGHLYRRRATALRDGLDALFHNLPYAASADRVA